MVSPAIKQLLNRNVSGTGHRHLIPTDRVTTSM